MKLIKSIGNIDLIQITEDTYCVRKHYKSFFFNKDKYTFYNLDLNGTSFTCNHLINEVTIGSLSRCEYIFNCNTIKLGYL